MKETLNSIKTLTCAAALTSLTTTAIFAGWEANLPDPIANADKYKEPYAHVGYLSGGCSGSVVKHKRVLLTAAHCLYNDDGDFTGLPKWHLRYHGTSAPSSSDGIETYGHRRYNDYVNFLEGSGEVDDKEAFNMDIASLFGFEDMAYSTASYHSDGKKLLTNITKDKRVVGYPVSLYDESSASPRPLPANAANEYKIHTTSSIWHRFWKKSGTSYYYTATGQTKGNAKLVSAPGNSGGPVFVKDGSKWKVSGVLVSGQKDYKIIDKPGSDDDKYSGRSGARALNSNAISELLDPLANAGDCNFSLIPSSRNHAWTGGNGSFSVKVGSGCAWHAGISIGDSSWVTITNSTSGKGNGSISYKLDENPWVFSREATISAGGEKFTITQLGSERIDLRDRGSLNRALSHTEIAPGQKLTIEADVANMGNVKSTKAFKVRYYASKNTTINPNVDTYLGQKTLGAIEKWKWANADKQVTIPADISGGTYYIGWKIDATNAIAEDDESNNTLVMHDDPVFVRRIDLRDAGGHKSLYNDVYPGNAVSFGGKIRCVGNVASGNFKVKFFLSKIENNGGIVGGGGVFVGNGGGQPPAPTIKPGDRLIGTRTMSADANSIKVFQNTAFVIDTNFQQGSYKVKYAIDASNEVSETDENNNVVQMSGVTIKILNTIDLRDRGAQHHSLSKTEVTKGGSFVVRGDVENGGNLGSGSFKVAFYASLDDYIDPDQDIAIGEKSMSGLFTGAHDALDRTVQLPLTIAPGDYHIGWIIDPAGTATQNQGMILVGNGGGAQTPKIEQTHNNRVVMEQKLKVKSLGIAVNPGPVDPDPIDDFKNPGRGDDPDPIDDFKNPSGTDPDPTDDIAIRSVRIDKGEIVIVINSVKGTTYTLETSTSMQSAWTAITTEAAGGETHEFRDAKISAKQKFYRVKREELAIKRRLIK